MPRSADPTTAQRSPRRQAPPQRSASPSRPARTATADASVPPATVTCSTAACVKSDWPSWPGWCSCANNTSCSPPWLAPQLRTRRCKVRSNASSYCRLAPLYPLQQCLRSQRQRGFQQRHDLASPNRLKEGGAGTPYARRDGSASLLSRRRAERTLMPVLAAAASRPNLAHSFL